jgi:hypothetical protein
MSKAVVLQRKNSGECDCAFACQSSKQPDGITGLVTRAVQQLYSLQAPFWMLVHLLKCGGQRCEALDVGMIKTGYPVKGVDSVDELPLFLLGSLIDVDSVDALWANHYLPHCILLF